MARRNKNKRCNKKSRQTESSALKIIKEEEEVKELNVTPSKEVPTTSPSSTYPKFIKISDSPVKIPFLGVSFEPIRAVDFYDPVPLKQQQPKPKPTRPLFAVSHKVDCPDRPRAIGSGVAGQKQSESTGNLPVHQQKQASEAKVAAEPVVAQVEDQVAVITSTTEANVEQSKKEEKKTVPLVETPEIKVIKPVNGEPVVESDSTTSLEAAERRPLLGSGGSAHISMTKVVIFALILAFFALVISMIIWILLAA